MLKALPHPTNNEANLSYRLMPFQHNCLSDNGSLRTWLATAYHCRTLFNLHAEQAKTLAPHAPVVLAHRAEAPHR
jgi:hypothetical protein